MMEEGSAAAALPSAAIAASMRMCFACGRVSEAHTGYIRQQGDARSLLVLDLRELRAKVPVRRKSTKGGNVTYAVGTRKESEKQRELQQQWPGSGG